MPSERTDACPDARPESKIGCPGAGVDKRLVHPALCVAWSPWVGCMRGVSIGRPGGSRNTSPNSDPKMLCSRLGRAWTLDERIAATGALCMQRSRNCWSGRIRVPRVLSRAGRQRIRNPSLLQMAAVWSGLARRPRSLANGGSRCEEGHLCRARAGPPSRPRVQGSPANGAWRNHTGELGDVHASAGQTCHGVDQI